MSVAALLAWMAAFFLFLVVWLGSIRKKTQAAERAPATSSGSVELTHPKGRAAVGVFGVFLPLLMVPRIVDEFGAGDLREAFGFLSMAVLFVCGGACIWAYGCRRVVLDQRGVRIIGFAAREVSWEDMKDIKAVDHGALKDIQFVPKRGRRIVLDSTMPGWDEFERRLLELASGSAKPLARAAMVELKRWRPQ